MDIISLGHASFKIRGKHATIITDPFSSAIVGLPFPRHQEADIVTVSHPHEDHSATSQVEGKPFIVSGPGEYEIKGVSIIGVSVFHDEESGAKRGKNTIYRIEQDSLVLVHLGDLGHMLSSAVVESLGNVDVLFIPVGGYYTIDAHQAVEVVKEIEPSVVIPMHYSRAGLNPEGFAQLSPVNVFLKEIGKEDVVPIPKLSVGKDKLTDEMRVVVLE